MENIHEYIHVQSVHLYVNTKPIVFVNLIHIVFPAFTCKRLCYVFWSYICKWLMVQSCRVGFSLLDYNTYILSNVVLLVAEIFKNVTPSMVCSILGICKFQVWCSVCEGWAEHRQ